MLFRSILDALVEHGRPADAPAALIYAGTHTSQRTISGTIDAVRAHLSDGGDAADATLIVGETTALRAHLRWFDERPLFGRRIVITRSRDQARELADELEQLGAQTLEAPVFQIAPAEDSEAIDRAAASVDGYQWVLFTSANSVTRFFNALLSGPRDMRALGRVSIGAIGPTTGDRLGARGIKPNFVMSEMRIDDIVEAMGAAGALDGQRVLIVRPDFLRDTLASALARRGAAVTDLVAYTTGAASAEAAPPITFLLIQTMATQLISAMPRMRKASL